MVTAPSAASSRASSADVFGDEPLPSDIPISLKAALVDEDGVPYRDFRRTLVPRWWRVCLDLTVAYTVLAVIVGALVAWDPAGAAAIAGAVAGALLCGYTIQFINNFFHEAAHYNLAPGRQRNDALTNLLMGWLFASGIGLYRRVHFQHHRALGTTMDSESSYFDALRLRYLAEGLLGLKLVRALRRHSAVEAEARGSTAAPGGATGERLLWIAIAAAVNLGLAAVLAWLGAPAAAGAWLGGLLIVFPFLASLRQLLEHRSEEADSGADYTAVDHGAVNRLFGEGPLASTLGSAGFNRHALHHWEPQVSYTRLGDIERYLLRTEVAPLVRERQTSYRETFLRLLEL